ncbi:MAG TPA: AAA family ATPase [Patescibacteria group bacterium]|nr:AAA family ATPase [Patescibacteria group bacterium]
MNLVLLYGPPAVGKLTVSAELSKITGYKIFHNHMMLNPLSEIFGYDSNSRKILEKEFRTRIVEEAINSDINLIVTGVIIKQNLVFYTNLIKKVGNGRGNLFLVQLTAPMQTLEDRVLNTTRKQNHKIDIVGRLKEFQNEYPEMYDKFTETVHLKLDTSKESPINAARKISKYYHLI